MQEQTMRLKPFSPYDELAQAALKTYQGGGDGAHDITHLERVWRNAKTIQAEEGRSCKGWTILADTRNAFSTKCLTGKRFGPTRDSLCKHPRLRLVVANWLITAQEKTRRSSAATAPANPR
jgi:hypothetical protein